MNRDHATTLAIAERAAEWLIRLPTADAQQREEFMYWLRQSPVHVYEFLLAVRCVERLRFLDYQRLLSADLDADATPSVAALPIATSQRNGPRISREPATSNRRSVIVKVAAVLAIIVLTPLIIFGVTATSGRTISTAAGEWRTEHLPDGSDLRIGPRTEIVVAFTRENRVLKLEHGELLIHVAKNPARPLFVESDLAVARAVGTTLAVSKLDPEITCITVQEGVVVVSARGRPGHTAGHRADSDIITLRAGQQVQVSAVALPVHSVDLRKELAWASGRLIFDTEQLSDAVREFNLRNDTQMKVLNQELARRPIRGMFAANDPMSFAMALQAQGTISIAAAGPHTLLLTSRSDIAGQSRVVR
ncbi:MAG TPA: FecR domain-containing protein [Steroidobacteraceae bacterium]|jgi:transmembrane sensor